MRLRGVKVEVAAAATAALIGISASASLSLAVEIAVVVSSSSLASVTTCSHFANLFLTTTNSTRVTRRSVRLEH